MPGEIHVGARVPARAPSCPYCHGELAGELWTCPKCGTGHHMDCARDNGKCTLLGCGARFEGRALASSSRPVVVADPSPPDAS